MYQLHFYSNLGVPLRSLHRPAMTDVPMDMCIMKMLREKPSAIPLHKWLQSPATDALGMVMGLPILGDTKFKN